LSTKDFGLPAALEALVQQVCKEQGLPRRRLDEIRQLVESEPSNWPACCKGSCEPCVDECKTAALIVLDRFARLSKPK
jgi:hypothetical protein